MSTRRICAVAVALSVVGGCASETSGSPSETMVVATSEATLPPATVTTLPGGPLPASTIVPDGAVRRWAEDMQALGDGVRRIHPNPFWRQSEAEFDASLTAAPHHLAQLDDIDARAEVMRLTAQIDGHTGVYLGEAGFHLYAIHLYEFGGDFAVIAAADAALVGATVPSIAGVPVAAAPAALAI